MLVEEVPMPIEPCLFAGEPDRIIEIALATLGLDFQFLSSLAMIPHEELRARLRSKELTVTEWVAVCDALHLRVDCLCYGYFRSEHKAAVRWALRGSYFGLPRTWKFWKLRIEIWRDLLREWKWQGQYYDFRLRWKARFQDFRAWTKCRLDRKAVPYDAQERIRSAFRHEVVTGLRTELDHSMPLIEDTHEFSK